MFEHIKANIFTVHGLLTSVIHVFVVVGGITCWVAFQTQVMGVEPSVQVAHVKR